MAILFLVFFLPVPPKSEADAAWVLGAFIINSFIYLFAAGGRGPLAEYWIRLWSRK
jgi:hypothetical protein